jgi:hypothetical protein
MTKNTMFVIIGTYSPRSKIIHVFSNITLNNLKKDAQNYVWKLNWMQELYYFFLKFYHFLNLHENEPKAFTLT